MTVKTNIDTYDYKVNKTIFRVTYGDITQFNADVLVSSDDNVLSMGGGVSQAILIAGGDVIRRDSRKFIPLKLGDVAVTSAGKLLSKYIFHAVTIDYTKMEYPSEESIRSSVVKCLKLADQLEAKTIVFPALGTGVAHFPFQLAADVMSKSIADYLINETQIESVTITLFRRSGVKVDDINIFYERIVALASIYSQSKRLNYHINELKSFANQVNNPQLIERIIDLQNELLKAQNVLSGNPSSIEELENMHDTSGIKEVTERITEINMLGYDKVIERKILTNKFDGLNTQLNIAVSILNQYKIEKAKYGGIGVPPRLENAIEDQNKEILKLEEEIKLLRSKIL